MYTGRELREVFHFCFLERLLKIADASLFVLKGGVNLRFFFNSPRYSEDMDLDVLAGSVATLKKNGYKVLDDAAFRRTLRTYGIADVEVNDPDKAKHTQTTQRFRVQLVTVGGERFPSKVEFSRRAPKTGISNEEMAQIDAEVARHYHRLSFRCRHYTGEAAVVQKLLALAGRAVTQARDVFDLEILHRGGYAQKVPLAKEIGSQQCKTALGNLESLDFTDFSGQVLEFLDDDARREFGSRTAWSAMQDHVRHMLSAS